MSVYVDDFKAKLGRMRMSHMMADTSEELHAMAEAIGVDRRWVQHEHTPKEHYDVSQSKRRLAVRFGAIEATPQDMARLIRARWTG